MARSCFASPHWWVPRQQLDTAFLPKILISKVILASTDQAGPVYPHSTEKPLLWRTVTPASLPSSIANTKLKERGWELGSVFGSKKRKWLPDSTLIALLLHSKHLNLWLQSVLQHATKWWGGVGGAGGRPVSPQIHSPHSWTFSGLSSNPHKAAVNRKPPLNSMTHTRTLSNLLNYFLLQIQLSISVSVKKAVRVAPYWSSPWAAHAAVLGKAAP